MDGERGKQENGVGSNAMAGLIPSEQITSLLSAVLLYFHLDEVKSVATLSITLATVLQ